MNKKIKKIFKFILLLSIIFIVSCGKKEEKNSMNDTLRIAIPKDIGSMNPHLMTSPHYVHNWIYEGLVTLKDGEIRPVLAESCKISDDGRKYTFLLKKNIKFSDGSLLSPELVKKNIEEVIQNKKIYGFLQSLREIEKINILDERTIEFILKNPCNSFLKDLTFSRPLVFLGEKGFEENIPTSEKIKEPIGTGMWKIKEYVPKQYALFERNENYWGEKPRYKYLKVYIVPEMTTTISMLKAGEIDFIYDNYDSLSVDAIKEFEKEGFDVKISEPKQVTSLSLNTAGEILKDTKVRLALTFATDNEIISEELFKGIRKPAYCYFTKDVEFVKDIDCSTYKTDLKKANSLLEEAGWKYIKKDDEYRTKNGQLLELKLSLDSSIQNGKIIAEILQAQYKKIGVKIDINQEESKIFRKNWTDGNFDMIMFNSWGGSYEPYATFAAMITEGDKFNIVQKGLKNREELHKRMANILKENDQNKIAEDFKYILETFKEEAVYIPLINTVVVSVSPKNIDGIEFSTIKDLIPLQKVHKKE